MIVLGAIASSRPIPSHPILDCEDCSEPRAMNPPGSMKFFVNDIFVFSGILGDFFLMLVRGGGGGVTDGCDSEDG